MSVKASIERTFDRDTKLTKCTFAVDLHNVPPLDPPKAQRDSFGENRDESALTALHYAIYFEILPHNLNVKDEDRRT